MYKKICILSLGTLAGLGLLFGSNQIVLAKGDTKLSVKIPNDKNATALTDADNSISIDSNDDGTFIVSGVTSPNSKVTIERESDFKDYTTKASQDGNFTKSITVSKHSKSAKYDVSAKEKGKDDSDIITFKVKNKAYEPKQKSSLTKKDSGKVFKNNSSTDYQQVSYDDLDSNSDSLNGKNIEITGTISKSHEEDGSYVLIVSMDNNQAENVMVAVDGSSVPKGKKLSKGDQVTIKGTGGGKQSTPSDMTNGQNIPYMDCEETVKIQ
ncbi:OB-fold protein [Limosilactobacillus reuteri]|uniref:OB-fold protein n=1 Tax=Limosilactobacillus reuteri TaxID=1598 RepID=UPI002B05F0DE|nr:hypothetical protein [Limosilactobacillus reuteri]